HRRTIRDQPSSPRWPSPSSNPKSQIPNPFLMGQSIHEKIHADLECLIRFVDRLEARARPLPELRDVGVVRDDGDEPLLRIVVLEDAAKHGLPRIVILVDLGRRVDLVKSMEDWMGRV